jgi:hypothetical protein
MRVILMALALGISIAAIASPVLAEPDGNKTDLGTIDRFLARSDRATPQINVGVVAGSDEPQRPAVQEQRYENQEGGQ